MEMQTVLALVVVFTGTTHGVETTCNATQNVSYYGTLGQPLYLQLMTNTTEYDMNLLRETSDGKGVEMLRVKANKISFYNNSYSLSIRQRVYYISDNGTLIINPVERNDSGMYRVEISERTKEGNKVAENILQLIINETHMTPTISNTKHPPLHNDTRLVSNGTWKIPNISESSAAIFLCLYIFYICKRRKNTYRAAELEEVEYADVSILKVEYGEANLQKCPTPEEVYLGGVFSLIVYAEIQSENQRGQSVIHSM